MKSAASVLACGFILATAERASAQHSTEVRRAQPIEETPIPRALPVNPPTPVASPPPRKIAPPAPAPSATPHPSASADDDQTKTEPSADAHQDDAPDRRQLDYANALFGRKLYDLAVPEYEKFLGQFPNAAGRASAYFYLGECYRALNRTPAARTAFQSVLDDYGESEFAGPAGYGVGEILFNQKDYAGALGLFHRSTAKTKESSLALSARYFEARCLENLGRKDEAANTYLQVIDAKNPNP
ncbi:MAG: tetratricopeptide repeat protein, partial [Verrucomicrobiota bacterium]|nr:tetratricopeptide repeat protein [Verrucomicrobiota bacterium]